MKKTKEKGSPLLAANIKKLRDAKGWTQAVLAEKAELTDGAIKMIETRVRWPKQKTLESIARALGVEPSELLKEPGPQTTIDALASIIKQQEEALQPLEVINRNPRLRHFFASLTNLSDLQLDMVQSFVNRILEQANPSIDKKSKARGDK